MNIHEQDLLGGNLYIDHNNNDNKHKIESNTDSIYIYLYFANYILVVCARLIAKDANLRRKKEKKKGETKT